VALHHEAVRLLDDVLNQRGIRVSQARVRESLANRHHPNIDSIDAKFFECLLMKWSCWVDDQRCKMHCLQRHLQGRSWNSSLPSFHESNELRTSTLAALVIAGGTIAALPFRRFSSDVDETAPATGPTSSILGEAESSLLRSVVHDRHQSQISAAPSAGQAIEMPPWDSATPDIEPQRRVALPLTFDDLMLPIDRPRPIAEQFEAVVDRSAASTAMKRSEPDRPVTDRFSGVASQPENVPSLLSASDTPRIPRSSITESSITESSITESSITESSITGSLVTGSLATSKIPPESDKPAIVDPPLVPQPIVRERAWIRQP
jgi:hypothetical protein